MSVDVIHSAADDPDPRLTGPLIEILDRWRAQQEEASASQVRVSENTLPGELYYQVLAATVTLGDRRDHAAVSSLSWILRNESDTSLLFAAVEGLAQIPVAAARKELAWGEGNAANERVRRHCAAQLSSDGST